ncbi:MAG: hypothetical protein JXQ96_07975 [Cyclobacteriaceae bacterium]
MNKTKFNAPKILLIILGVLVAILIGFNSKAVDTSNMRFGWTNNSKMKRDVSEKIFQHSSEKATQLIQAFLRKH